jgi:DNA-binding HxlR family transcriptional regulator
MRHKSFKANACPVARSLDTIGEWWSLLIVRDALSGVRRFSDFQKSLGLAKNVLSTRLKKLVACGILEQVPASDGSAYREYALTPKGRELFPVIVALRQWGESYLFSRGEKRFQVLDKRTRKPVRRLEVQSAKGEILVFPGLAEFQRTLRALTHLYFGKVFPNMGAPLFDCSSVASS